MLLVQAFKLPEWASCWDLQLWKIIKPLYCSSCWDLQVEKLALWIWTWASSVVGMSIVSVYIQWTFLAYIIMVWTQVTWLDSGNLTLKYGHNLP